MGDCMHTWTFPPAQQPTTLHTCTQVLGVGHCRHFMASSAAVQVLHTPRSMAYPPWRDHQQCSKAYSTKWHTFGWGALQVRIHQSLGIG